MKIRYTMVEALGNMYPETFTRMITSNYHDYLILFLVSDSIEVLEAHLQSHETGELKEVKEVKQEEDNLNCPLCEEAKPLSSMEVHLLEDHKISSEKAKKLMETVLPENDK